MLSRRALGLPRWRAVTVTCALALVLPMIGSPSAGAAPGDGAPSPIGDGGIVPPSDYIDNGIPTDDDTEVDVGQVQDSACATLVGVPVSAADINALDLNRQPEGDGRYEYQLCARDAATAAAAARANPTLAAARAHCAVAANLCGVFVIWRPDIAQRPPYQQPDRQSYLNSFFELRPDLASSPGFSDDFGLIANFPTWFFNTVVTAIPRAIPDAGIFGGAVATAFHLRTTFRTNGDEICDVTGFQNVGTRWEEGRHRADAESPDCGYTYPNIGQYEVTGATTWLIIVFAPPFFVFVFPITLSRDFTVNVKESQILTGADARRTRVN
jgi:hypothetical protein